MTDTIKSLLEDVQTVYEGKGMIVHPNSFDKLRLEVIKLDNINKQQEEENRRLKNEVEDLTGYCNQIGKIKTGVLKLFENVVAK